MPSRDIRFLTAGGQSGCVGVEPQVNGSGANAIYWRFALTLCLSYFRMLRIERARQDPARLDGPIVTSSQDETTDFSSAYMLGALMGQLYLSPLGKAYRQRRRESGEVGHIHIDLAIDPEG